VVTVITIIVAGTIYFRDGTIFQDFPSNFLMVYCLEISKQNLIPKVNWIKLLTIANKLKDLNQILDLFKRLIVTHKPTRFDK
jgi:hypothetical protein